MELIFPVPKLKVGCVCLVAVVKKDNGGNCIELGYAVFCGDTFVGQFANLTDALKRFQMEVKRVYPNPAEHPRIVFIDASGKKYYCETLAEAKELLLSELARLKLSHLPTLVASDGQIIRVYPASGFGPSVVPQGTREPFPQP